MIITENEIEIEDATNEILGVNWEVEYTEYWESMMRVHVITPEFED